MKKTFFGLVLIASAITLCSCNSMEKDAKDYAKKTCKCLAMTDINDPASFEKADFLECSSQLDKIDSTMQSKYSSDEDRQKFTEIYLDELMNSDLPDEWKDWFRMLSSFNDNDMEFEDMPLTDEDASSPAEALQNEADADAE